MKQYNNPQYKKNMKQINKKLPIYKQAWVLVENFKEIGIRCVYYEKTKTVNISLLNAPIIARGVSDVQMTLIGCFESFSEIRDNYQEYADKYKSAYRDLYSNNPEMLKYIE